MKKIVFIGLLLAGTATFQSCKKCMECEFVEVHGSHSHEDEKEKCGSRKELKKFEEEMQAEAKLKGFTVTCHEGH
ncbi:MAG: hypothetical protein H0V01_05460 [Bacteroidetes bacterium]|nr:hypothetical protein [Bacteroidota bacterium]HET6243632.1 hypothetical protein [Bacteroidia bacterium]